MYFHYLSSGFRMLVAECCISFLKKKIIFLSDGENITQFSQEQNSSEGVHVDADESKNAT